MRTNKFIGIYQAEGTLWGEIKYVWRKLSTKKSCSLCDITHSGLSEKTNWQSCRAQLPIPFELIHLNERSTELLDVSKGRTPCVLAQSNEGYSMVFDDLQLQNFHGRPEQLIEALNVYLSSQEEA